MSKDTAVSGPDVLKAGRGKFLIHPIKENLIGQTEESTQSPGGFGYVFIFGLNYLC